jgi:hypothetical protein
MSQTYQHISDAPDKKASTLVNLQTKHVIGRVERMDYYNTNIVRAANQLVRQGNGDAVYQTQWASGTTAWVTKSGVYTTIDKEGRVETAATH